MNYYLNAEYEMVGPKPIEVVVFDDSIATGSEIGARKVRRNVGAAMPFPKRVEMSMRASCTST